MKYARIKDKSINLTAGNVHRTDGLGAREGANTIKRSTIVSNAEAVSLVPVQEQQPPSGGREVFEWK